MAYSKGIITIPNITDNVIITVTTEKIEPNTVQPLFDISNNQNYDSVNGYYKFAGNMEGAFGNCYIPYDENTIYNSDEYDWNTEDNIVQRYSQSAISNNTCTYTPDANGFYVHIPNSKTYIPPRIDTGVCLNNKNSWTISLTTQGWFVHNPISSQSASQIVCAAGHYNKGKYNSLIYSDWISLGDMYFPNFYYKINPSTSFDSTNSQYDITKDRKIYYNSNMSHNQIQDYVKTTRIVLVYQNNIIKGYINQNGTNPTQLSDLVLCGQYKNSSNTNIIDPLEIPLTNDLLFSSTNIFIGNNSSNDKDHAYYGYVNDFKIYDYAFSGYETAMYLTANTSSLDQVEI